MIPVWKIRNHTQGDTFGSRRITFPFDITNCRIDMQFRQVLNGTIYFFWSTENLTFEKISANTIIMKGRILDSQVAPYISDMQIIFQDGTVETYFNANLRIIADVTQI